MKYILLLVIGAIAGLAGAFYLDRSSEFRSGVDRALDTFLPPVADVQKTDPRDFARVLADHSIAPCFTRNETFDEVPPVWMSREPLGPNALLQEPLRSVPDISKHPGLVKLEQIFSSSGAQKHHCAATRIGQHWFLTAAHCVRMKGASSASVIDMVVVKPRADVMQVDSVILPVDGAVCHAAWYSGTGKFDDDIALVHVSDVSALADVKIARIDSASAPLAPEVYENTYFAGWGKNGRNRFLQGDNLAIEEIGETFLLGDNRGDFAPCVGDSGGPLYAETTAGPRVVGVLSSVTQDACPPYDLAFYTRVKTFEPWIRTATKLCHQNGAFVCKVEE